MHSRESFQITEQGVRAVAWRETASSYQMLYRFSVIDHTIKRGRALPESPLIDVNGILYGTRSTGGGGCSGHGCGTVYTINLSGRKESDLPQSWRHQ